MLGACTPKPVQVNGLSATPVDPPAPASIPDVSSWQGAVNWSAVKKWQLAHHFTPAGIFKMGEYVTDPYAARNNAALRSLHMWRAGYWFLRNTGCAHEASQIVAEAKALGLKVVFLDDEVPEARNYDGCITPTLKHAGLIVGEYASPGAYPGGKRSSNAAWIAAYGPSHPPLAPWGGPIKAFQCTDGIFGCVTSVPGLGRVDMSVNFGVTKLGVKSKPRLICFGSKASLRNATCKRVRSHVASEQRALRATDKSLKAIRGDLRSHRCRTPYRRGVCVRAGRVEKVLAARAKWFDGHIKSNIKRY